MAYQTDETRARNEIDREALSYKYPGIFNARRLHERLDIDARWQLEGYLLGRASAEQTAVYTGIDPETVIWYERLFYNVLPHLEHDTYITSVVMGSSIHHGLLERDFALLWKMIGYGLGHVVLRDWIKPMGSPFVRDLDQAPGAETAVFDAKLRRKAIVAIHTIPVYNNQAIIFDAWQRSRELARQSGGQDATAMIVTNIQAALCALPLVVGKQGAMDLPKLAHYDEQSVELRAGEQMQIACGHETEAHRQALTWKFPETATATTANGCGGQG
jgi:hypothetical protein